MVQWALAWNEPWILPPGLHGRRELKWTGGKGGGILVRNQKVTVTSLRTQLRSKTPGIS